MNTNDISQAVKDLPVYARHTFNKMLAEPNQNTDWTVDIANTTIRIAMSQSSITEKTMYLKRTSINQFFADLNSSSAKVMGNGIQSKVVSLVLNLVGEIAKKVNTWVMKMGNPESVPAPTNSTEISEANTAFLLVGLYLIVRDAEILSGEHRG